MQHQLATADEHHVVQDALHVGNEVGGDEQSGVRVEVGEDGVDDVVSGGGIHAADGLVQQIQPCAAAHDQDQLHLFPCTLGHLLDALGGTDLQSRQHMLRRLPVEVRIEITEKVQQLHHRHPVGEVGALRQIGYQPPGVRAGGLAVDEQLPR